jgi:dTDP-4-dehydrorhamnose 3,5-epimerase
MKNNINIFTDDRGAFIPYDLKDWDQMNVSINDKKHTFRGLHYQTSPPQTKLVKIIQGKVLDIVYNLDTKEVKSYILDKSNDLYIPSNYAHGFLTLEDNTIFTYLVKGAYSPISEHSIVWDTIPEVKSIIKSYITKDKLTISEKDKLGK